MVPVRPINGGKIVSGSPLFQCCLFRVLCPFDTLFEGIFNGVPIYNCYTHVVFTKIFVRKDSNVFVVWVSFYFIIRLLGESIRTVGSAWFIFQEQVVLSKFGDISCNTWANFAWFSIIQVCMISVHQDGDFCAFEQVPPTA